jgi:hypothetical protein
MARRDPLAKLTPEQRRLAPALQRLPNVGPAVAADLVRLGIRAPEDLAPREPDELYASLCALDGRRHDPCMWDTLAAVVAYARGEPARPWWHFTPIRKAREQRGDSPLGAPRPTATDR